MANGFTGFAFLSRGIRRAPLFLLSFGIALLFLIPASASATTWTVTGTTDSNSGTCDQTTDKCTTLRDAILAANKDSDDTIDLTGLRGTIDLTGTLTISEPVIINGPGANLLTISGQGQYQIFYVAYNGTDTVNISGLTLADGNNPGGGAILDQGSAYLNVKKCAFTGNSAGSLGGGAIDALTLTVTNSTFVDNKATGTNATGGAIYAEGPLAVVNSTFVDNKAAGPGASGGAILVPVGATLTVVNSTFVDNKATGTNATGGAIYGENGGTPVVENDIFADNTTSGADSGAVDLTESFHITEDHNLFYGNTGGNVPSGTSLAESDVTTDPELTALGYFGGPTETMMPEVDSAAICKGSDSDVSNLAGGDDQRGFPIAPAVGACAKSAEVDIGSAQTNYVVVTSTSDTATGSCPSTSSCTLPTAVAQADPSGGHDIDVGFDPSLGNLTITLSSTSGPLSLTQGNTVIIGPPDAVTIDGGASVRILSFSSSSTPPTFVSLYGLTLENASSSGNGGAIENRGGDLAVGACTFHDDSAANGGAIDNEAGTLTVTGSTFHDDSAADAGGAINSDTSSTQGPAVADSTFYGNSATYGGAIDNEAGTLTLTASTLRGNSAGSAGGGIDSEGGLTVVNSTLYGNSAANTGGAINGDTSSPQGLTVVDSTFIGNSAAGGSGAIDDSASSGPETVQNDIFSGNIEGKGGFAVDFAGASPTEGYNLFYGNYIAGTAPPTESDTSLSSLAASDVTGNPDLTALGNFGGPTEIPGNLDGPPETVMPEVGSPAICAGLASDVPVGVDTDQRGFPLSPSSCPAGYVDIGSVQTNYVLVKNTNDSGTDSLPDAITQLDPSGGHDIDVGFEGLSTDPANPSTITLSGTLDLTQGNAVIVGPPDAVAISGDSKVQILNLSGSWASPTNVTLYGLTLEKGSADDGYGGAVDVTSGVMANVDYCSLNKNYASHLGGAIRNNGGILTVTGSTFSNNKSGSGGGIANFVLAIVTNSTFYGNSATSARTRTIDGGGAIWNVGGTMEVGNSTFDNNSAVHDGGAINTGGTVTVADNIFDDNNAGGSGGGIYVNSTNPTIDEEYNLFHNNAGGNGHLGTHPVYGDPELPAEPGNYGGLTLTMQPKLGGAAICAGTPTLPSPLILPSTDQRGFPRTTLAGSTTCIDIGSVQTEADAQAGADYVDSLYSAGVLTKGQDNSLVKEIDKASEMASEGKYSGAINNLNDYITEVEGLYANGVLTQVQEQALLAYASAMRQSFPSQ